jgi:fatty-acyl-CoA synthase
VATPSGPLAGRAAAIADLLRARGCVPGDRVATALPDGPACFEMLFACAMAGFVLVPLHPAAAPAEREVIAGRTGARLLVEAPFLAPGEGVAHPVPGALAPGGGAPLLVLHTSGSTGRPKGVTLTHANVVFSVMNQILGWGLRAGERTIAAAPLSHAGGIIAMTLPCLQLGGTVYFPASAETGALLALAARERISAQFLPPHRWAEAVDGGELGRADLTALRVGATGGRALPRATVQRLVEAVPGFTDAYGLTEAASCSTLLTSEHVVTRNGSIGCPLPVTGARIVDEAGSDLAPGEVGDLVLAGPTVMHGYWGDDAGTARTVRDGWLHTGDLARRDAEGFIFVEGRRKEMIHTAAGKVLAREVERTIEEHRGVVECAVVPLGGRDGHIERVAAAVVWRTPGEADEDALRRHCEQRLAPYKVPDVLVARADLPRTRSGKVRKHDLAAELEG